ncbi:MAG: SIMPL domain-containing protein [Candidatus Staskawiczbacteria bacterium]|nr:SIMPL domain-containing protein [Candidatus Staskawiczbacteria bacterium]
MEEEIRINKIEPPKKMITLATVLVISIVGFLILKTVYNFQTLPQNYPQEIVVMGEGKTFIKPDIALVSLGVKTEANKSVDAVNQNNEKMNAVTQAIKDLGVDEKDIKTSAYNLYPVYDYTESGRIFKGYSLDQQISVKIKDFNKISDVLDKATSLGANTISDLQFTVDDLEKARADARAQAIDQAKAKAVILANQAGLKIIKLVNISEGYQPSPQPMYGMGGGINTLEKSDIAPSIQPGQSEINTTIYLTYRVR